MFGELDGDSGWCSGTLAFDIRSGNVDGEDVGGTVEFVAGEDERWVIAFFDPPFGDGVEGFEVFCVGVIDEAEDVEVGLAGAEFAGGGGAVEDDRDEVRAGGGLEAVEEFFELRFHVSGC